MENVFLFSTIELTTDGVADLLGKQLFDFFDHAMPCITTFDTVDPYPHLEIHANSSKVFANITTDFQCRKNESDPAYYHVTNVLALVDIDLNISILSNLTIIGSIQNLDATITSAYNSTIGEISLWYLESEIAVFEGVL